LGNTHFNIIFEKAAHAFSQNGRDWKGPLWVIWSSQSRVTYSRLHRPTSRQVFFFFFFKFYFAFHLVVQIQPKLRVEANSYYYLLAAGQPMQNEPLVLDLFLLAKFSLCKITSVTKNLHQ